MSPAFALLAILIILLIGTWATRPRAVGWSHALVRRHPGVRGQAEWMAPPAVVRQVQRDYLAAWIWSAETAIDWARRAADMPLVLTGPYLRTEMHRLTALSQDRSPRLAGHIQAQHHPTVRAFSNDGLRCLVIDHQTRRHALLCDYWTGRLALSERLEDQAFVYLMAYDRSDCRWKIEKLVQELPLGWGSGRERVVLQEDAPPLRLSRS